MVNKDMEMSQGDIGARALKPSGQFICTQEAESEQEVGPGYKPQSPTPMTYVLQQGRLYLFCRAPPAGNPVFKHTLGKAS